MKMQTLTNMTLGKKITLLTMLGLILAVIVFGYLSLRAVNQATDVMLQDRLTTAGVVADYIDEALGRAVTELENTARLIPMDSNPGPRIEALQDAYRRLSVSVQGIYLLNEKGQIMWSQPGGATLQGEDISHYPGISEAIKAGRTDVSALVRAPVTGTPVVLLTSPTKDVKGSILVAVDLAQSSIGGFVKPIRLGQTGYVEIVDQNGIVVARTEPGPKLAPFEKSDHSGRFAALIAAGEPTRGLCHTCHEPVQKVERRDVLAFVPLSRANWGVVIRQSEEEALTPINGLRQNLLYFGGGLIFVALLLVTITTRDVVGRIRMLTAASEKMAGGELAIPISSSRQDELGVLMRSFDEMRVKVKTARDELERRTKELSSLLSVSEILASLNDLSNLDEALGNALDRILEVMKESSGSVFLLNEAGMLCCLASRGLPEEYAKTCLRAGEGLTGAVARSGKTMIADLSKGNGEVDPGLAAASLKSFLSVPLSSKGQVLGVLNIASKESRQFSPEDVRLLEDLAGQIATAIENARLHQEVRREDQARGELLREVLSVQEEERKRIARELHDETSQVLASLNANLEAMSEMLPPDAENIRGRLKQAQALSISVLDDIHRLIYELRPALLDDLGLVAAVRWLADNNLRKAGINVNFKTVGRARRLEPQVEVTLFRVIQETVNNIARHSKARNAEISLRFRKSNIAVTIKDDGTGFDVEEAISSKDRPRGLGLLGMKERLELVKGTLSIASRPGSGTDITIEIPLNDAGPSREKTAKESNENQEVLNG
ncbi:MAG: GAF domain-containing protein [Dehalococcoidales bacterium]|nr:GAF domain-containing protein [Dehalococcoidales bacterium]